MFLICYSIDVIVIPLILVAIPLIFIVISLISIVSALVSVSLLFIAVSTHFYCYVMEYIVISLTFISISSVFLTISLIFIVFPCSMQVASLQALRRKRSRLARTTFVKLSLRHPGPAAAPRLQWPMQGAPIGPFHLMRPGCSVLKREVNWIFFSRIPLVPVADSF